MTGPKPQCSNSTCVFVHSLCKTVQRHTLICKVQEKITSAGQPPRSLMARLLLQPFHYSITRAISNCCMVLELMEAVHLATARLAGVDRLALSRPDGGAWFVDHRLTRHPDICNILSEGISHKSCAFSHNSGEGLLPLRISTTDEDKSAYLFLISAAIVMKACSTLVAFFALVSRNGMPISSANACHLTKS